MLKKKLEKSVSDEKLWENKVIVFSKNEKKNDQTITVASVQNKVSI